MPRDPALDLAKRLQTECLGVRVNRLQRLVSRRYTEALRPCGLTLVQVELLAVLTVAGEPTSPSALASALAVEKSTVSRNVALLIDAGFVAPDARSPSGRTLAVAITPAGSTALTRARTAWAAAQAAIAKLLGPAARPLLDTWVTALQA